MIQNTILVFIPDTLEKSNVGFLYGFVINIEFQSEFYITRDKLNIDPTNCIGYCGMSTNFSKYNWLHINYYDETLKVNEISCDNNQDYNLIFVVYDYYAFKTSEVLLVSSTNYGQHFNNLSRALKYDTELNKHKDSDIFYSVLKYSVIHLLNVILLITNIFLFVLEKFYPLLSISSTISLIHSTLSSIQWALRSIIKEQKINLKVGNIISTKIIDIILGFMIIYFVTNYKINLSNIFNSSAKELIFQLQELLKFLMGSPVGLKLNHAFNSTLGNFFLYHIALWKTFLIVTSPLISKAFTLIFMLATFGFSFQVALIADVFTVATFHVYCIYVYAARLYGAQIRGLLSLWKLFIGRKHNPLRNRVDSCQYSHHQLFVGTLGFTILLFLLPTTLLYYIVFITLRLVLNICDVFLRWLRQTILTLPLYVTLLWALNSPRTKGTVFIQITDQKKNSGTLTLQATLRTASWWKCIAGTRPEHAEITEKSQNSFGTLLHSITVGDLL